MSCGSISEEVGGLPPGKDQFQLVDDGEADRVGERAQQFGQHRLVVTHGSNPGSAGSTSMR